MSINGANGDSENIIEKNISKVLFDNTKSIVGASKRKDSGNKKF